jgi:hypothetical protein
MTYPSNGMMKAVAFALVVCVAIPAQGKYEDNSGNLPGIGSAKPWIIVGAAAGGGLVLARLLKKRNGSEAQLRVQPSKLSYGAGASGQSFEQKLRISNNSAEPVAVETVAISGSAFRFSSEPALPIMLAPGESTTLPVNFAPAAARKYSGNVAIRAASNGGKAKTWKVDLSGKGI